MLLSGFAFVSLALTLPQPEPKKGSLYILKAEKAAGKGPQHFPSSFLSLQSRPTTSTVGLCLFVQIVSTFFFPFLCKKGERELASFRLTWQLQSSPQMFALRSWYLPIVHQVERRCYLPYISCIHEILQNGSSLYKIQLRLPVLYCRLNSQTLFFLANSGVERSACIHEILGDGSSLYGIEVEFPVLYWHLNSQKLFLGKVCCRVLHGL